MAELSSPESEIQPAHQPESREEQDLRSFLSQAQCGDVTILVANITETMRTTIGENFSPIAMLDKSLLPDPSKTEDEKIMNPDIDPATVDVEKFDKEKLVFEERVKELSSPKVQELKASVLRFYDEWREGVLQRIGEVVNSQETEASLKEEVKYRETIIPPCSTGHGTNTLKIEQTEVSKEEQPPKLQDLFPRTKTPLTKLPIARRTLILHSILLILISLEHYNALSRVLLLHLTSSLKLSIKVLEKDEEDVARGLLEVAKQLSAEDEAKKKIEGSQKSRKWKVGLASVAGAAVMGITGGLAAPLVAAGVGSIMGGLGLGATAAAGYLGSVAGSAILVGSLFGAYGGRMTGKMMDSYAREVEDFAFIPVHGDNKEGHVPDKASADVDHRLRVTIGITGWLTEKEQVISPWKVIGSNSEVFALRWELQALLNLGHSIEAMLQSATWSYAKSEIIRRTIFAEFATAMWPLALLKISRLVDNPFSIAKSRADKAGEVLANALINKAQGERPVTLIGYSLGARVIYSCLMSLANNKAFGLVESAVLIGAPCPSNTPIWRTMRTVVSGRLVNVYSANDSILGFLYRTSSVQLGVAGLQKVDGLSGVENVDVSKLVSGHLRYRHLVGSILQKIGFEDINKEQLKVEEAAYQALLQHEKEQDYIRKAKEKGQIYLRKDTGKKSTEGSQTKSPANGEEKEAETDITQMENEVQEKTRNVLTQKATT